MCTAARSEICDRRRRGIHERRRSAMTPKGRRYFGRRTRGRLGALPRAVRTRRAGRGAPGSRHACRPSGRRCATSGASRERRCASPRSSARSRRKGSTRLSRSVSAGFTIDEPKAPLAMRSSYRRGPRPAGPRSSRRWRRFADRPRGKASLRRPRRCSRKILPSARVAQFIPSLRTWPRSNYACAWRREGNEAFIAGDYRGEYWR